VTDLRRGLRRRLLAGSTRRRAVHFVASSALRVLWRQRWVPGDPRANVPSDIAKRVRVLWLESLPAPAAEPSAPAASEPVDVMIPVGPNDVDVAPLALAGVRANVRDPIRGITIVAPPELATRLAETVPDVDVVDETSILTEKEASYVRAATPPHRTGWYLQQFIKLKWCLERSGPLTYVVDADTVLVRPQRLHPGGRHVVFAAQEYHDPYFDHLARMLGDFRRPLFGTTVHQMLYRREWLRAMADDIERANPGRTWIEAIVDSIDPDELSSFSEGECYGQWVVRHRRRQTIVRPFRNTSSSREAVASSAASASPARTVAELSATYADRYDSVSLHYYIDKDPLPEWRRLGLQA
jgi:hypothetical protein